VRSALELATEGRDWRAPVRAARVTYPAGLNREERAAWRAGTQVEDIARRRAVKEDRWKPLPTHRW
jgi:hypothetical protein